MKFKNTCYSVFFTIVVSLSTLAQDNRIREYVPADLVLFKQIEAMDKVFFDAYNSCDLKKQKRFIRIILNFFMTKPDL